MAVSIDLKVLMKMNMLNSKQQGNVTEIEVMLAFLKLGYNVLTPYGDCERYDFVTDINNHFYKIQVKSAKEEDEGTKFSFNTASTHYSDGKCIHSSYTSNDIDFFATTFRGQTYLIPVTECGARSKSLRLTPPKNGQLNRVSWAKDYELEEMVKTLS